MKILISFVLALGFPVMLQARDSVPLPSSLKHLTDKENYFLQKAHDDMVNIWKSSYHYDEQYSRSILDSLEIMCVPTFKIKRKCRHHKQSRLQDFLACLKPCDYNSFYFFFKNGQYFGGLHDSYCTHPGITGDSLAHTKFGTLYEKTAMEIRDMNPEALFSIQNQGDIWLILRDHSLLVYDPMFDRFYQPQEYLDRTQEELDELVKQYLKGK